MQGDTLPEEYQSLISSLPKENGWINLQYYQHQGFWHHSKYLPGSLACQYHFQARDSDIFFITTPKCGTTWLKALGYALINRKIHAPEAETHPMRTISSHKLVPFLDIGLYFDCQEPDLSGIPAPRLFATHLPIVSLPDSIKKKQCKVVYLCREPKDTLVSMWNFSNKLKLENQEKISLEEAFDKFCKGVSNYGPFWDHVLGYWKYSLDAPNKVLFLKYEELKQDPVMCLEKLAEFCGCSFTQEEKRMRVDEEIIRLCNFESMSRLSENYKPMRVFLSKNSKPSAFLRKGEVGDWANYLTPAMVERIDGITQEKLHVWGLKF